MSAEFAMKVGDTLVADCVHKDAAGDPVNLTTAGITIESAVRSADSESATALTVTLDADQAGNPGAFRIEGNSEDWGAEPPCDMLWDIRYFQDGRSFSTRTVQFKLNEPIA